MSRVCRCHRSSNLDIRNVITRMKEHLDEYLKTPAYRSLDECKILQIIDVPEHTGLTQSHFADEHLHRFVFFALEDQNLGTYRCAIIYALL